MFRFILQSLFTSWVESHCHKKALDLRNTTWEYKTLLSPAVVKSPAWLFFGTCVDRKHMEPKSLKRHHKQEHQIIYKLLLSPIFEQTFFLQHWIILETVRQTTTAWIEIYFEAKQIKICFEIVAYCELRLSCHLFIYFLCHLVRKCELSTTTL